jgi:membrane associated rhomboid family serine protease
MRTIPTITRNLLIVNVLVFILQGLLSTNLEVLGGLYYFDSPQFRLWQPLTYMFMHGGWTHLFFNMFALWMFGGIIEQTLGDKRFITYYMVCGLGAALTQELAQWVAVSFTGDVTAYYTCTVGASGAIYGILLAFGMLYPDEKMFIFPLPVPIKAKWFVCGYVVIELFSALSQRGDGVAHVAHLGGMLFGWLLLRHWRRHPHHELYDNWGQSLFDSLKERRRQQTSQQILHRAAREDSDDLTRGATRQDDIDDNARRQALQQEIDVILDKIRKSGYDSLTKDEKRRLFDMSKNV